MSHKDDDFHNIYNATDQERHDENTHSLAVVAMIILAMNTVIGSTFNILNLTTVIKLWHILKQKDIYILIVTLVNLYLCFFHSIFNLDALASGFISKVHCKYQGAILVYVLILKVHIVAILGLTETIRLSQKQKKVLEVRFVTVCAVIYSLSASITAIITRLTGAFPTPFTWNGRVLSCLFDVEGSGRLIGGQSERPQPTPFTIAVNFFPLGSSCLLTIILLIYLSYKSIKAKRKERTSQNNRSNEEQSESSDNSRPDMYDRVCIKDLKWS